MNSFQLFLGIMAQILFFTFIYMIFLPDPADWSGIPPEEDRTLYQKFFNRFYFSITVLSTVGLGDIYPLTNKARTIVMIQYVAVLMQLVSFFDFLTFLNTSAPTTA